MAVGAQADFDVLRAGSSIDISRQGAITTIALSGAWDLAERDTVRDAFQSALARHPIRVVLDLSRLTFMDSTGVHGVLGLAHRAARLQIDLVLVPGPPAVQRLFDLCQLSDCFALAHAA